MEGVGGGTSFISLGSLCGLSHGNNVCLTIIYRKYIALPSPRDTCIFLTHALLPRPRFSDDKTQVKTVQLRIGEGGGGVETKSDGLRIRNGLSCNNLDR